jgi:hypothetical protein
MLPLSCLLFYVLTSYIVASDSVEDLNKKTIDRPLTQLFRCIETKKYISSPIELKWINKIELLADDTKEWKGGCNEVQVDRQYILKYLSYWKEREDEWVPAHDLGDSKASTNNFPRDILSYFEITETCEGESPTTSQVPIEPLMGFLRHPLHYCIDKSGTYWVNKDYMLPLFSHEINPLFKSNKFLSNKYLFDLGNLLHLMLHSCNISPCAGK